MANTLSRGANPLPSLVFVDCEATGLHVQSYPVSVGLAWCDGRSQGMLVRPHADWASRPWSPMSLRIHGITPARLVSEGRTAEEVANWINAECSGRIVVSDAPAFESHWLGTLFSAVRIPPQFQLADISAVVSHFLQAAVPHLSDEARQDIWLRASRQALLLYPHTHVAEEDALGVAMGLRMAVESAQAMVIVRPDA
jgi:DNA polymerase III epsilon subunit-like protein